MADFNWINAVPARDWSVPDRGWSVLSVSRREFVRKSELRDGQALGDLFSTWSSLQVHRNYALLCDDLDDPDATVFVAMRGNPALGSGKPRRAFGQKREWAGPPDQ